MVPKHFQDITPLAPNIDVEGPESILILNPLYVSFFFLSSIF